MKWISVEDRLPEEIGPCLISYSVTGADNFPMGTIGWSFFNSAKKFAVQNGYAKDVTHWMPLPEPPKEIEEEER